MANILQVTNTPVTPDRGIPDNQKIGDSGKQQQQVQNPVDPSRVVRADGQGMENTKDATAENGYSIIDYGSNLGAFIKKITEGGMEASRLMERLFFGEGAKALFDGSVEAGKLMGELMDSLQLQTPEELLTFLKGQLAAQAKFSGPLFDAFRSLFKQDAPEDLQEAALLFLKAYNDYSSGTHFLTQMRTIAGDIRQLLLRGFQDEFDQILKDMDWTARNGDTEANAALLNNRLIPFLSNYISRTHDYGAVRDAVMMFIFQAVRYENGSLSQLNRLFDHLMGTRGYGHFFKNEASAELGGLLRSLEQDGGGKGFADAFSDLMLSGINGRAGLENIQQFYNVLDSLLLNESVYMQVIHLLIPFNYQGKDVNSELWVDPDAGGEDEEGGRRIKLLLKFSIESLGAFDLLLTLQDRNVDMQLNVPEPLWNSRDKVQNGIADIFKKNGMNAKRLIIKEKTGDIRVEDVFSVLRERGRSINVRI